jgi:hypothetical protein
MLAHDHSPGLAFCCSETVTMLAKILTKDIGYISISFFGPGPWIWIGYNILFLAWIWIGYNILFLAWIWIGYNILK